MIDFLAGAAALGYSVAGVFFLRFWRTTRDRLFLAFCAGFALLACNQVLAVLIERGDERTPFVYSLRVLGFLLILWAIIDKNLAARGNRGQSPIRK